MKVDVVDDQHRAISSAILKGRVGATPNAILLYATLLGLATFWPYFALMHLYSMRRLRPLLADLPRTHERITLRDKSRGFASKVSFKLLVVMGIGGAAGCFANGIMIATAMLTLPPKNVSQAVRLCGLGEGSDEPLFLIGHGAEISQRGMQA